MSTLWLVATPIGNLADLSPRAVDVLAHVGLICCEDTRRTGLLLQHAGVKAELPRRMTGVATLSVPLVVDGGDGPNWERGL